MSTTNEQAAARNIMWRRTAYGIGFVALAFSVIIGGLLVVDATRAEQISTVRSPALQETLALARQTPENATTVALARDMDRLARHAYFCSVTFRQVGLWMLAIGLVVGLFCLHLAGRLAQRVKDPRLASAADPIHADRRARLAMLASGAAVLMLVAVWQVSATGCCTGAKPTCCAAPVSNTAPVVAVVKETAPVPKPAPAVVAVSAPTVVPVAPVVAPVAKPASAVGSNVAPVVVAPPLKAVKEICWGCFRGPKQGVSPWTNAPSVWDDKKGVLWKVPLTKPGFGSPVVWDDHVFVAEGDDKECAVMAFDAATGKPLWRHVAEDLAKDEPPLEEKDFSYTTTAGSTPVCDADGVYAVFSIGTLVALGHDGKLRWQLKLGRIRQGNGDGGGYASSLALADGKIFVQMDVAGSSGRVVAVDAKTGKIAWENPRSAGVAWSSPIVVPGPDGKQMVVVNAGGNLTAFDAAAGKQLWEVDGVGGLAGPSPFFANGSLYAVSGSGMIGYKVAAKPEKLCEYSSGSCSDYPSPVIINGLLFMAMGEGSGLFICVDLETKKELWTHEIPPCYGSLTASGDRVYATSRDGTVSVFAAEKTARLISSNAIGDSVDSTPAMADGRIYIRSAAFLWCIGAK